MSAPAIFKKHLKENRRKRYKACDDVVLVTGLEPVLCCQNGILSRNVDLEPEGHFSEVDGTYHT